MMAYKGRHENVFNELLGLRHFFLFFFKRFQICPCFQIDAMKEDGNCFKKQKVSPANI
jgi:hypothetical protein